MKGIQSGSEDAEGQRAKITSQIIKIVQFRRGSIPGLRLPQALWMAK